MIRLRVGAALALCGLLVTAGAAGADVKATEKTQTKFEGMLGRMMGLFGGKAAKEGIVSTVSVKGDRKMTANEDSATLVDLAEEKVYEISLRDKSYRVYTFAEMRKKMEEARAKADEDARKQQTREKKDANQKEMEIDFSAKETGKKREISGYSCREVVVTVAVHEKGKTLEQAGGILMTVDSWMAPKIAAMREITDFDMRYAKKMAEGGAMPSAEQMAQALAMYPGLKQAMARMQSEKVNMDGTPIETVTIVQSVTTADQATNAKKQDNERGESPAGALGGMLGRFGKKKEEPKEQAADAPKGAATDGPNKSTFMTTTLSVLSIGTSVGPQDIAVPVGFKLKG
ncbi:MAG TPA: hypothetical protein VGK32_01085 [Vicinamibacterales bacterium]|jgi:hypothetical protein